MKHLKPFNEDALINDDISEINDILNIARDEGLLVGYTKEYDHILIRRLDFNFTPNPGSNDIRTETELMDVPKFIQICDNITERLKDIDDTYNNEYFNVSRQWLIAFANYEMDDLGGLADMKLSKCIINKA